MLSISTPEHAAALKEARENAVRKLIAKGFSPDLVYGSIERKDEKALRQVLKKLTRQELRDLFKEDKKDEDGDGRHPVREQKGDRGCGEGPH